jgi:hypothetical protein
MMLPDEATLALTRVGVPTWTRALIESDAPDELLAPHAFAALVVHVYVEFGVRFDTVTALISLEPDRVSPPSSDEHDAAYAVIGFPFAAGGVTSTASVFIATTRTVGAAGTPGTPSTTTGDEVLLSGLSPTIFVLTTLHVYVAPAVRPVTVTGLDPDALPVTPDVLEHVTVDCVMVDPFSAPSENETDKAVAAGTETLEMVGAPG